MLRVFRSIVPDFRTVEDMQVTSDGQKDSSIDNSPIPAATASLIREYISNDVLTACVQSINEHYYVELQKEIATFIGAIIGAYSKLTQTPRNVLLSIPNLRQEDVDDAISRIVDTQNSKVQRNYVLQLLSELKGVSISELGKLGTGAGNPSSSRKSHGKKASRSQMAQEFMTPAVPQAANGGYSGAKADEGLEDVAGLFNQ
jgi:exportin-5